NHKRRERGNPFPSLILSQNPTTHSRGNSPRSRGLTLNSRGIRLRSRGLTLNSRGIRLRSSTTHVNSSSASLCHSVDTPAHSVRAHLYSATPAHSRNPPLQQISIKFLVKKS